MLPNFELESHLGGKIIGIDEVGRGPIAGPVVAAGIILDNSASSIGINDSKKLSKAKRETIFKILTENYPYTISFIEPEIIDSINILQATLLAMRNCIDMTSTHYDHIVVDGNVKPLKQDNCYAIVKGDATSISIAAASIIAKVYRDRLMDEMSIKHPFYSWERNSGYGTKAHYEGIRMHGICELHRKSFLKKFLLLNSY